MLAATLLCGERKCYAMVDALSSNNVLPWWITLKVEKGSISIADNIQYYTKQEQQNNNNNNNNSGGDGNDTAAATTSTTTTTTVTKSQLLDLPVILFQLS